MEKNRVPQVSEKKPNTLNYPWKKTKHLKITWTGYLSGQSVPLATVKVHTFWEGHKILRNFQLTFDCMYCSQKLGEDFAKFCGILRIYELYISWKVFDIEHISKLSEHAWGFKAMRKSMLVRKVSKLDQSAISNCSFSLNDIISSNSKILWKSVYFCAM